MNLFDKVKENIYKYSMLNAGDYCIAAVSGGADSVCLLSVLAGLADQMHFHLKVVHVNHMIRGAEADRDEAFVRELSEKLNIPCVVIKKPVPELAKKWGMTEEEAGRKIRYEAFRRELQKFITQEQKNQDTEENAFTGNGGKPAGVIATAHNQEDLVETVIFNMVRGSGLSGMKGILPVRDAVIRPLLYISRSEIENYLNETGQSWCTDSTNSNTDYTRNRIRHHIMPELKLINRNAVEHIAALAGDAAEMDQYISEQTSIYSMDQVEMKDGGISVPVSLADAGQAMLWDNMIRRLTGSVCHGLKDIGRNHIDEINKLLTAANGSSIDLPNHARVIRNNDRLFFYGDEMTKPVKEYEICIDKPGIYPLPEQVFVPGLKPPYELHVDICDNSVYFDLIKKEYTKYLDYDKISDSIFLRSARAEDTMIINSQGGSKRLNRIFTDNKINEILRKRLPVIADGSQIIWIPGIRIGEYYKVSDETRKILILELRRA